jgi:hypothetical protein
VYHEHLIRCWVQEFWLYWLRLKPAGTSQESIGEGGTRARRCQFHNPSQRYSRSIGRHSNVDVTHQGRQRLECQLNPQGQDCRVANL